MKGALRVRELRKQLSALKASVVRLDHEIRRERTQAATFTAEAEKKNLNETALESRRKVKDQEEKARLRREREKFWPRTFYMVCITLDATHFTPVSSRRSSISSVVDLAKTKYVTNQSPKLRSSDTDPADLKCDLSISYVTASAFWSPCYDIQLDTTSTTGTLLFDAQLTNTTSESWDICRITLSTS